jgi:hypothetical protein
MRVGALPVLLMNAIWTHENKDGLLDVTEFPVKWVQMNFEAEG